MRHAFLTQDYPPMGGGMARRHVELCRRLAPDEVIVSTVAADAAQEAAAAAFDAGERYPVDRQPFTFSGARTIFSAARWSRWLKTRTEQRTDGVDIVHCGNIRPAGYPSWWAHRVTGVPYLVYVYGGDLLRERRKVAGNPIKKYVTRRIFEESAGVVAISDWTGDLARSVMAEAGVAREPRVLINPLGTDPDFFRPSRDGAGLRSRFGIGDGPLLLTVARLVPHKGIDVAIQALAALAPGWPTLRYLVVGTGDDRTRLDSAARTLNVADRVIFAGALSDAEIADAYSAATLYVGLSRVDAEINAEGFGIAFVEAAAAGTPSVAGDSGGVRSAVLDNETGLVVDPTDARAAAGAIGALLADPERRLAMGRAARRAVERHFNWDRVARDVREFAGSVVESSGRARSQ
jgi:phosphatidylinositol alpha-1,6-mannosyltransferase